MHHAALEPVVAIPARNEAERLPRVLDALARQGWVRCAGRPLPVVLVLNNCTDGSLAVARAVAACEPALSLTILSVDFPASLAHVGSARRLAMEEALKRAVHPASAVLLTTDADAAPRPDWIEANLRAVFRGADLVGGRIVGDGVEEALLGTGFGRRTALHLRYREMRDRLASLVDPLPHDPWPRHSDHTGASLAVRGDVYAAVGGLPPLPVREDIALVARVRAAGFRLVHPVDVEVEVSARLDGRAPGGMADCLKAWLRDEAEGRPHLVEAPEALLERLHRRAALRGLDGMNPRARSAVLLRLGIPADGDVAAIPDLIELHAGDDRDEVAEVPVEAAIEAIGRMIDMREGETRAA